MFILPMDTPGITVDPVHTMGTERTNATYYDDVRVGDDAVLGEVNEGWRTMTVALAFERGVMGGTTAAMPLLRHFHDWAADTGVLDQPLARERMARSVIDDAGRGAAHAALGVDRRVAAACPGSRAR